MGREKKAAPRPEPGGLDPRWTYLGPYSGATGRYSFDLYRADGLDNLYFADPREDPQPYELRDGSLDLDLDRGQMTELRDLLTWMLDNWGKRETRNSHPEPE